MFQMIAVPGKNLTFLVLNRTSNYVNVWRSPIPLHFFSTATIYDMLRNKYDFPHELASRESNRLKTPENADSILSFFKATGFSNSQLQKIVKSNPKFLSANLEHTIRPKIKVFQDEGFSSDDISKMITRNPPVLRLSLNNNIIPSLSVLKKLLGSNKSVAGVIRSQPRFLNWNMENTVVANVEFLKRCGVPMDRIRIVLSSIPTAFYVKPDVIRRCVEEAKKMGIDATSKAFIYAITTLASMSEETWELKLQALRDMGFSESDVSDMFRKAPLVFSASVVKIQKTKELLLATGKFDVSSIVDCPMALKYSIEMRYKPRLRILGILESRNLIENWPTLRTLSHLSDAEFFERFVSPFSNQVSDVIP